MATAVITATSTALAERARCVPHTVVLKPYFEPTAGGSLCIDPPAQVRPGLFIGSQDTENSLAALRAAGITHILQAGAELVPTHRGFVYQQLSVSDEEDEDMVCLFHDAFSFIKEARKSGAVLVHCAQGVSRSATILIGYLMAHSRLSFDTALAHVQQARPIADPNEGFTLQLQEFERLGCDLNAWRGWDKQRLEKSLRSNRVSGRRAVHGMSEIIRRFHKQGLEDDTTVFLDNSIML